MRVLLCWLSYEAKTGAATGIRAPLSELPTRGIAVYLWRHGATGRLCSCDFLDVIEAFCWLNYRR